MRDLAKKWSQIPEWETASMDGTGLAVRSVSGLYQVLVSGDIDAVKAGLMPAGDPVGLLEVAAGDPYPVRLARDRVLLAGSRLPHLEAGWHREGFAVTRMDAGFHVFEISGPSVPDLLERAMTIDLEKPGPCAAVLFAGFEAVAYFYGNDKNLRLHVDRGLANAIWRWIETVARNAAFR